MLEQWLPIGGWPYEVSDRGRVRRATSRTNTKAGQVLTPVVRSTGYVQVSLSDGASKKSAGVHLLVAVAFVGPPPSPRHEVAHGDGNRANNNKANLRWATAKENAEDRERHGRTARGESIGTAVLTEALVKKIRASGLGYRAAAREFEIAKTTVTRAMKAVTWRHVT